MNQIKLFLTDIDGVWTDGGMYYDNGEMEFKKFNTYDSAGVLFCKLLDIPVGIITGEDTLIVKRRAEKLKIDFLHQGVRNKVEVAKKLCEELSISLADVAYIGDDINDMKLLSIVGYSGAPRNAPQYIKDTVDYETTLAGGQGAFREFVENYLVHEHLLEGVLEKYNSNLRFDQ